MQLVSPVEVRQLLWWCFFSWQEELVVVERGASTCGQRCAKPEGCAVDNTPGHSYPTCRLLRNRKASSSGSVGESAAGSWGCKCAEERRLPFIYR